MRTTLKVNPIFLNLLRPLAQGEKKELELQIIEHGGAHAPIVVWNETILDGHNRYEICSRLNLPFDTVEMDFRSDHEALQWMRQHQLARRNLSNEERTLLIGEYYNGLKQAQGYSEKERASLAVEGERELPGIEPELEKPTVSAQEVAETYGLNERTVRRHAAVADAVADKPELREKFLNKEVSQAEVLRPRQPEEQKERLPLSETFEEGQDAWTKFAEEQALRLSAFLRRVTAEYQELRKHERPGNLNIPQLAKLYTQSEQRLADWRNDVNEVKFLHVCQFCLGGGCEDCTGGYVDNETFRYQMGMIEQDSARRGASKKAETETAE